VHGGAGFEVLHGQGKLSMQWRLATLASGAWAREGRGGHRVFTFLRW